MRVVDPAGSALKLQAAGYPEPLGDFMAFVPGTPANRPTTLDVAYLAHLIIHRYAMLGLLDENGFPVQQMGILQAPEKPRTASARRSAKLCSSAATIP